MSEKELWVLLLQTLMILCKRSYGLFGDEIKQEWITKLGDAQAEVKNKGVIR